MRLRRPVTSILAATALVIASALPATADLKPPPPLPDDPTTSFFYNLWFGPTPEGWTPEGAVIADSGFRSFPNGFPYANYGGGMSLISTFFGTPDVPQVGLTSVEMRSLYGDGVCTTDTGLRPGGPCTLTPVAEYYAQTILDSSKGGVCFGMAGTAGAIYNGEVAPSIVGASTLTFQSKLTNATQRTVLRNFGAQNTLLGGPLLQITPTQVIENLQAGLAEGDAPYVLVLYGVDPDGREGGHAINPYAVHDRGNGVFDIAVYDNNYPTRARAVHVDTVQDTWEYLVQTNPSGPRTVWTGDAQTKTLGLVAVADIIAQQPCPFCAGRPVDLVTFSPLPTSAGELNPFLRTLDGAALPADRYEILPELSPPGPTYTASPSVEVIREDGYKVFVDGSTITESVPFDIDNVSPRGGKFLSIPQMPAGTDVETTYRTDDFSAVASAAVVMDMTRAFTVNQRHFAVQALAGKATAADNGRRIAIDRGQGRVVLGDHASVGGRMVVAAEMRIGDRSSAFRSKSVAYPAGGEFVLVYRGWKKSQQAPQLWLDRDSDGTLDKRIPMTKVGS